MADGISEALLIQLKRQISISRREIVSLVEAVYGTSSQWEYVRSQLLTLLGDKGLEGGVSRLLKGKNGNDREEASRR